MTQRTRLAAITAVGGILAVWSLGGSSAHAETPADTLVIAQNIQGALTMDTGQIAEGAITNIFQSVCDKLIRRDPSDRAGGLKLLPGLAQSWEVSADGRTVIFKLRAGLKHPQTGNPVTAEDAVWSTRRVMKLGFGAAAELQQWGFTQENIDQAVTALDETTIRVELPEPAPVQVLLYSVFADRPGFVLDRQEIMKHEENGDLGNKWLQSRTACVGPYRLQVWQPGDSIVFQRNDDFFEPAPLRRLIFRNIPESGAQRLLVEKGDVDVAVNLNATDLAAVRDSANVRVQATLAHEISHLAFNQGRPGLRDPRVVQAFRYLIDYKELSETVFKGLGVVRQTLVPIGAFGAIPEEEGRPYALDIAKAQELLKEAGVGDQFTATLRTTTVLPWTRDVAQHLQQNAEKAGIKLTIELLGDSDLVSKYRSRDFDIVLTAFAATYPDADSLAGRHAWNPDNRLEAKLTQFPTWRVAWSNDWFNEKVMQARVELDPAKRVEIYREIQLRHMKEGPFVYLFQNYRNIALGKSVKLLPSTAFTDFYGLAVK